MKDWKWPAVWAFTVVVASIVVMFGLTEDPPMRNHLIGYFDAIVPFIVGAGAGSTVGGAVGFAKGRAQGRSNSQSQT